jgi:DNA (cytosine-5)-methyltransferase 1
MEDGSFPAAPIWSDLTTFDGRPFRGGVDLICAGLPCQPYSVAGRQLGDDDERALWPEFIRVVGEVEPALVFLENVPPFIRYFRPVGCELQRMGYRVEEPLFVTAAECGAAHKRERVFILAHHHEQGRRLFGRCGLLSRERTPREHGAANLTDDVMLWRTPDAPGGADHGIASHQRIKGTRSR